MGRVEVAFATGAARGQSRALTIRLRGLGRRHQRGWRGIHTALWPASDETRDVTGVTLPIDAGVQTK